MIFVIYFLFPISSFYIFEFIGEIYLTHLLIILLSIYFYFKKDLKIDNFQKKIIIVSFIWLIAQLFSNFINNISFDDNLKGLARIIFFILSFYVFFQLNNINNKYLIYLIFSLSFFTIAYSFFDTKEIVYNWKISLSLISVGLSLSFITSLIYSSKKNKNLLYSIFFFLISFVSLYFESRFIFLINFIIGIFLILIKFYNLKQIIKMNILSKLFILIILTILPYKTYNFLYTNNLLSENLTKKQTAQKSNENIIFSGRNEIFLSIESIKNKPLLGYGSWPKNCEIKSKYFDVLTNKNYNTGSYYHFIRNCHLGSHSIFFQAWVESGIIGAIVWLFFLALIIKNFFKKNTFENRYNIFKILIFMVILWDILFSPFGSISSIYMPLFMCVTLNQKTSNNYNA